jgi:MSHA biogenesis protein MshO
MQFTAAAPARGFTVIELVVAMTVTAIVATFAVTLISAAPNTLEAATRRASLREDAVQALDRIEQEWLQAQPNTLRFRSAAGVLAIEHLTVLDSATLFSDLAAVPAAQRLTIGAPDAQFETLAPFTQLTLPFDATNVYLSLHSTALPGADAYALADVITAPGTRIQVSASSAAGQDRVQLTPATTFTVMGSTHRIYLLAGPVTYLCDPVSGTLQRYSGYAITPNQALRDSDAKLMAAGAQRALLATGVGNCRIASSPSATAGQTIYSLTVTFRSGSDQVVLNARRVNDNAG